jgi:hypothetical protein
MGASAGHQHQDGVLHLDSVRGCGRGCAHLQADSTAHLVASRACTRHNSLCPAVDIDKGDCPEFVRQITAAFTWWCQGHAVLSSQTALPSMQQQRLGAEQSWNSCIWRSTGGSALCGPTWCHIHVVWREVQNQRQKMQEADNSTHLVVPVACCTQQQAAFPSMQQQWLGTHKHLHCSWKSTQCRAHCCLYKVYIIPVPAY